MTTTDLFNTIKFDSDVKNIDYTQKNTLTDSDNAFSSVFEAAGKSYNFSFDKTDKFSYSDLNKTYVTKEPGKKEFKSE